MYYVTSMHYRYYVTSMHYRYYVISMHYRHSPKRQGLLIRAENWSGPTPQMLTDETWGILHVLINETLRKK